MKRILFALILLSSLCCETHGQDYYRPPANYQRNNTYKDTLKTTVYFFSFNLGLSLPLSDYGNKSITNNFMTIGPDSTNAKGFANLGFHGSINGGIFVSPNFGFALKIAYNSNSFDETTLNALVNGNYDYTINGGYSIWQFMGGVFGNFQVDKVSSVWLQGMVGLINADFPSFSIYNLPPSNYPPNVSINGSLQNANDFAYSLSIGYEKQISRNVSFITTLTYTGSELVYPTFTWFFTGPYSGIPPPYTQNTPVTMSFGSLDFSLGLLFHL